LELIADLETAGFSVKPGKGSHRKYRNPKGIIAVISGKSGDDAKHYQEKQVMLKIQESKK
jgi:predicted RNA binding protein YcfA (HicA-like mRNA interferase family)